MVCNIKIITKEEFDFNQSSNENLQVAVSEKEPTVWRIGILKIIDKSIVKLSWHSNTMESWGFLNFICKVLSFSRTWIRLGTAWDYQKTIIQLDAGFFTHKC
jgi:hypothetical protein